MVAFTLLNARIVCSLVFMIRTPANMDVSILKIAVKAELLRIQISSIDEDMLIYFRVGYHSFILFLSLSHHQAMIIGDEVNDKIIMRRNSTFWYFIRSIIYWCMVYFHFLSSCYDIFFCYIGACNIIDYSNKYKNAFTLNILI